MSRSSSGALARWHAELRRGDRTRTTYDPLWAAACWEAAGDEGAATDILAADQIRRLLEGWSAGEGEALAALPDHAVDQIIARAAGRTHTLPLARMRATLAAYRRQRGTVAA